MDLDSLEVERRLFEKSYILKARARAMMHWLGTLRQADRCLCIGPVPAALQYCLRTVGGQWEFLTSQEASLPQGEGLYERVLVIDQLEWIGQDHAFIEACHQLLKPSGLLLIDAEHNKRWTFWRPVRRMLGVEVRPAFRAREGYSESGLFDLLKDGYDVQGVRTYSRFMVEGVETLVRLIVGVFLDTEDLDEREPEEQQRVYEQLGLVQMIAYPFFLLAAILDWFLFFTRGYRIMAVARRRLWKPRRTPVLRDGRTLADATLNTRIGTATQFH